MDEIEIGKKIILRPINRNPQNNNFKPPLLCTKKFKKHTKEDKKRIAQRIYYRKHQNGQNHLPVQMRLGGQFKRRRVNVFPHENFIKPRIRKSKYGLTTEKFRQLFQPAQQRLVELRRMNAMNIQGLVIMANTNKRYKYPPMVHSIQASINPDVQLEIQQIMLNCARSTDVENEMPLHSEDATEIKLHTRFSTYP